MITTTNTTNTIATSNYKVGFKKRIIMAMIMLTMMLAVTACNNSDDKSTATTVATVTQEVDIQSDEPNSDALDCQHSWVEETEVVHHDAVGHMDVAEENGKEIAVFVEDKPAWDEKVTVERCSICGETKK